MKKRGIFLMFLVLVFLIAGCGPAIIAGQWTTKSFSFKEVVPLNESTDINKIVNIGRSLGYDVDGIDEEVGVITFSRSAASAMSNFLIRKADHLTLVVSILEGGKKLRIETSSVGNFGSGGEESARNAVALFKERLQEREHAKL